MGALRAAELDDHGMIGIGDIYSRFRSGELCGDDEVALLHGDAQSGYRPFSEPLVHIRHNLARATHKGVLTRAQSARLIAAAKHMPFGERRYSALLNAAAAWLEKARLSALTRFLTHNTVDLKRQDALSALAYASRCDPPKTPVPRSQIAPLYQQTMLLQRTLPAPAGSLQKRIKIAALLKFHRAKDKPSSLRFSLTTDFFLLQHPRCPEADSSRPVRTRPAHPSTSEAHQEPCLRRCRRNAMTLLEWEHEAGRRSRLQALLEEAGPERKQAAGRLERLLAEKSQPGRLENQSRDTGYLQALKACLVADWTRLQGANPDSQTRQTWLNMLAERLGLDQYERQAHQADLNDLMRYHWAVRSGPAFFGFVYWSFEVALVRYWQFQDQMPRLVLAYGGSVTNHG